MNLNALENNITDAIRESITKLGFEEVPLTLYFPKDALCGLLEEEISEDMLKPVLEMFATHAEQRLGRIRIAKCADDRYAFTVSPEGIRYVHEHTKPAELTQSLTNLLQEPDCDIMEIASLFRANGDTVMKKSNCEDFDYVLYFRDGKPDDYRYCFHEEMGRMIYHRFTEAEFAKLFGEI